MFFIIHQFEDYRNIVRLSCRPFTLYSYKAFSKNKNRSGKTLSAPFSKKLLKQNIVIFITWQYFIVWLSLICWKSTTICFLYCSSFLNFQTFLRKPLELEIPEKASFQPWKFCKLVCMTPLGNSKRVPPAGHILNPMV